jgi:DNA-binding transcriptional LysR family regulator
VGREYASRIRRHLDQIRRDTLEISAGHEMGFVLEVAVVPTFATQWLIPRLPDFSRLHPNITVNLSARSQPFSFQENAYDAAIYFGDQFWPNTRGGLIFSEGEMVPVCSPAFRDANGPWDESAFERCRHVHLSTRAHAWRDWYAQQGWDYTVHASRGPRYELFTMVVAATAAGMGIGLAPRILIEHELRTGELVIPIDRHLDVSQGYYFAYPEGRPASGALEHFKQWVLGLTPV